MGACYLNYYAEHVCIGITWNICCPQMLLLCYNIHNKMAAKKKFH